MQSGKGELTDALERSILQRKFLQSRETAEGECRYLRYRIAVEV